MQWQYKTINISTLDGEFVLSDGIDFAKFEKRLNELRREEWELVSGLDTAEGTVVAVFKRRLEVDDDDSDEGWETK